MRCVNDVSCVFYILPRWMFTLSLRNLGNYTNSEMRKVRSEVEQISQTVHLMICCRIGILLVGLIPERMSFLWCFLMS